MKIQKIWALPSLSTAMVVLVFISILKLLCQSALFADGAYFMMYNLQNRAPLISGGREFSDFIGQFPLEIAINFFHFHNTYYLSLALALGFQTLPIVFFALAFYLLSKKENHSKILLIGILLNVGFSGTIGQSSLGISLVLFIFALLQSELSRKKIVQISIILLTLLSIRVYESTALLAPFLFFQIFLRRSSYKKGGIPGFLISEYTLLGVALISSVKWIIFPFAGGSNRNSLLNFQVLWQYPTAKYCIFLVLGVIICSYIRFNWLLIPAILIFIVLASMPRFTIGLGYEYQTRGVAAIIISAGMGAHVWAQRSECPRKIKFARLTQRHITAVAILILFTSLNTQLNWLSYLNIFRNKVNSESGRTVSYESLHLDSRDDLNTWAWTNPSLSFIVRSSNNSSLISNPVWYQGSDLLVANMGLNGKYVWRE